jgi:hypothetical protein
MVHYIALFIAALIDQNYVTEIFSRSFRSFRYSEFILKFLSDNPFHNLISAEYFWNLFKPRGANRETAMKSRICLKTNRVENPE